MAVEAPEGLARAGLALWNDVTSKYGLRADELRVLESAARQADLIAILDAGLDGAELLVRGSQGQMVINPIITEVRQHRTTFAALLRQLKLPDDEAGTAQAGAPRSTSARAAASARWSNRGA